MEPQDSDPPLFEVTEGIGPVVAVSQHGGHAVRAEVAALFALSDDDKLREEDPHTDLWAAVSDTRLVAKRSRFEVDLNRDRPSAVYVHPEDSWGLEVWKRVPPDDLVERSRAEHDAFYAEVGRLVAMAVERHGHALVLDLHSYNHMREGPDGPPADPAGNPEVNVGTGTMDRSRWAAVVDRFIADLSGHDFLGRHLDVRENVKFVGRELPTFVHTKFSNTACALALEFKKFWMNEWTGEVDWAQHGEILEGLRGAVSGAVEELRHSSESRRG